MLTLLLKLMLILEVYWSNHKTVYILNENLMLLYVFRKFSFKNLKLSSESFEINLNDSDLYAQYMIYDVDYKILLTYVLNVAIIIMYIYFIF